MKTLKTSTDTIEIVEYHPNLAVGVAEMWNNSQDGWGGGNTLMTPDQVRTQEENSTNIKLFLAMDGEKVVGYCGLSEYREDEGALYIPLLNVRGDYHGKKIGKKLVLRALEDAINMKWPRLDLFTWPGNTKAVPLYKKCGFFWEDRDDTTHLMNFMPTVLNTELVQSFFEHTNWYEVSTRKIEVTPDGRKEGDYHFYQYSWDNGNEKLIMEFERSGRGLRFIETSEYMISATIKDFQPVFGSEYSIEYKVKNKTCNPLSVSLMGNNDKNITFNFEKSFVVEDEVVLVASFFGGETAEEPNARRTHPVVQTDVNINGKKATLKVGVKPKFPAKVETRTSDNLGYVGSSSEFYIDITNNFNEEVTYSFVVPENDLLNVESSNVSVKLAAKESRSLAIPYTLKKHGFYNEKVLILATKYDGIQIQFQKQIHVAIKGFGAVFYGECDEYYHIYNGQYHVWLRKFDNTIIPGRLKTESQKSFFMYPKLGKPYSEELAKLRPEKVEFIKDSSTITLKASFSSRHLLGVSLHSITKLYSEGLIEHYYEIENTSENETSEPIWLNVPVYHLLDRAVIPYKGKYIEMNDSIGGFHTYWDGANVTENWIFSRDRSNPRGLCWHPNDCIQLGSWFVYFEHSFGEISTGQTVKTNPLFLSIGAIQDWQSFREFSLKQTNDHVQLTNHLEMKLANQNPIVDETVIATITDYKATFLNGDVTYDIDQQSVYTDSIKAGDQASQTQIDIQVPEDKKIGVLRAKLDLDSGSVDRRTLFLKKSNDKLTKVIKEESGLEAYSVNNGCITIKAAPDFSPSLYTLEYDGVNWFDTSFPTPQAKAWWSPWVGGIFNRLTAISPNSLLKEEVHVSFTSFTDNLENVWEGLKISVDMKEHKEYKGLQFHQYYLLLPGLPVLCHFTEIGQKTNQFLQMKTWETTCFFKVNQIADNWLQFQSQNGDWQKVYGGKSEMEMKVDRNLVVGSNSTKAKLQVISDLTSSSLDSYINKEVIGLFKEETLNLKHGGVHFTTPTFFMFTDDIIPDDALADLKRIRFGK
jgi:ribosomal protein S18 acetylase RimI-like enzyme